MRKLDLRLRMMDSKKKYERFRYTEETLEKALTSIINGETTINKASKFYNIPKSTLHNKVTNKVPRGRKMGPATELTSTEESELVQWILNKAKLGFPMHRDEVSDTVETYLNKNNRVTKFTNNRPGEKWLGLFLKRHPDLTKRNAEMISKARAAVTEEGIRKWFNELEQFLLEENGLDIKYDPTRIFNTDETGAMTCPKTGIILGPKNFKNTYEIAHSKEKESITVLCTFSADGKSVPPFVTYPYKRMPPAVAREFPDEWFIGRSESGWMVSETFFAYIKLFYEWLVKNNIKMPVLLFLDGHKSHINREMFEFCSEKKIYLFCLHPNATYILQPCDVGIFGPVKKSWKKVVRKHKQATTAPITKQNFASIFKKAYDIAVKPSIVRNSFRACGLFPINADAVDYSKCINTRRQEIAKNVQEINMMQSLEEQKDEMRCTMKVIENEIGQTMKNEFTECYNIKRSHAHPYFPLWSKCKTKVEDRLNLDHEIAANSANLDAPLDLSNTSIEANVSQGNSVSLNENCSTSAENENSPFVTVQHRAQIHVESLLNEIQQEMTQTDSCSIILNDSALFRDIQGQPEFDKTDDILDFIINQDTSLPLIIPLPWYDTLHETINNYMIEDSSTVDVNHLTKQVIVPENDFQVDLNSSECLATNAHLLHLPVNSTQIEILTPEKIPASSKKPNPIPLNDFLTYPKISTSNKKKVKKESMPYGLTGQKCKEYLRRQDEERQADEMEMKKEARKQKAKKKKEEIEIKKSTLKRKNEEEKENQKKKTKKQDNKQLRPFKINKEKIIKVDSIEKIANSDSIFGKYVIVQFKTDKRVRFFVGKVLMTNAEEQKYKVDFLRKKSVSEDIVTFVRPQIPDVAEVDYTDVQRVLGDPNISKRGFISFSDGNFKDIE